MTEHSNDFAVFHDLGKVSLDDLLTISILPFLGILGESLLLRLVPK